MKLLIVILNYRVTDLTIDCLRSLEARVGRVPGARVAVCENGTGGDAPERLRKEIETNGWGDWARLTVVFPNLGFCGGNNVVIREALAADDKPEYVLLLNADTIVRDGALESLVEFMDQHPGVGVAGSKLLFPDGRIQGSPFRFFSIASELDRGLRWNVASRLLSRYAVVLPKPDVPCRVEWVSGASMILRRTMLDEIGLLDEGLYTYLDDLDICRRAANAGWETWWVPASEIVHLEGASTGVTPRLVKRWPPYIFQARRRYMLKHHGAVYTALADAAFIAGFALWRLRRFLTRQEDTDPPHYLFDSIRNSVFVAGFRITDVPNPAFAKKEVSSG